MKRSVLLMVVVSLGLLIGACSKKPVKTEPSKEPSAVERIDEKTPVADRSTLSEERATPEDSGREGELKRIHFDFDKYFLREDMKPVLQQNAEWLSKHRNTELLIEGHCDERGTIEYNIALGEKRAEAAKQYLVQQGVSAGRIRVLSYGKSKPLVAGNDEASYYQNRRAEFVLTKK